jgi:hypothetical protein
VWVVVVVGVPISKWAVHTSKAFAADKATLQSVEQCKRKKDKISRLFLQHVFNGGQSVGALE